MSEAEIEAGLCMAPGAPGGSDYVIVRAGAKHGTFASLREWALFLDATGDVDGETKSGSGWRSVGIRYLWCDQSSWPVAWGMWALEAEMRGAEEIGRAMRPVTIARLSGANHFVSVLV